MNSPLSLLRHWIGLRSPIRISYHWCRGVIAYLLSGFPSRDMYIVGITGTKGKTTTSTLVATALETAGYRTCLISTAQVWMPSGKRENHSKMTMDSPFRLWKLLRQAKKEGVTHVVLETSSHGIYYFRNYGIRYAIAALTNIAQDHLDLHGTMDHYVRTKARLFKRRTITTCILPTSCEYRDVFVESSRGKAIRTYGTSGDADIIGIAHTHGSGMSIDIHHDGYTERLETRLVGGFNVENILTAYTILDTMKVSHAMISRAWREFTGAPGRMEPVPNERGITILVDYAHTEQSLRSVLETLRSSMTTGKILLVFGATGDRDTTKRPKMGHVADILADRIILTDDDTYTEPSDRIIDMVRAGIDRPIGELFQIIPDREGAIIWALDHAILGDTVLIAGKGCETMQITNAGPIPWSDRGIAEAWCAQKG